MVLVKRLALDIRKPHHPNPLGLSRALAQQGGYRVKPTVLEMDESTETLQVVIEGADIDFGLIHAAITDLGGSLHSIDEVEVVGEAAPSD
jgi:hypothetical protein